MGLFDDTDDEFDTDASNGSDLVKQLRKQLRQVTQERDALQSETQTLRQSTRSVALKDILTSKGVNPKIATFIKDDVEPTEAAVTQWLVDYGDVFNVSGTASNEGKPAEAEQTQDQQVESPEVLAYQQALAAIRGAETGASAPAAPGAAAVQHLVALSQDAKSSDDLFRLMRGGS